MLKISESERQPGTERPVYPIIIKSIVIEDNPFNDIVPRIRAEEKRAQEKARREAKKNAASRGNKKQGVKNISLMSFGEEEVVEDLTMSKGPTLILGSAHDTLKNDPTLRSEVREARGLPPEMPLGMGEGLSRVSGSGVKRKAEEMVEVNRSKSQILPNSVDSYAFSSLVKPPVGQLEHNKKRNEMETNSISESARVKAEILKVQADLKKFTKRGGDLDDEVELDGSGFPVTKEMRKTKPKESGAALLAAEGAKYTRGGRSIGKAISNGAANMDSGRSKKRQDDGDMLDVLEGFRGRIRAAAAVAGNSIEGENDGDGDNRKDSGALDGYAGEILEGDDDDEGWMSHSLKFRKDATMDQHSINEYEVIDPRAQNMTLEDAKQQEARLKRQSEQRGGSGRLGGAATARADHEMKNRERGGFGRGRGRDDDRMRPPRQG